MHSGLCQRGMITPPPTEARERVSVACVQCRPAHPQPLRFIGSALGARKRRRNRPALDPLPCPRALLPLASLPPPCSEEAKGVTALLSRPPTEGHGLLP